MTELFALADNVRAYSSPNRNHAPKSVKTLPRPSSVARRDRGGRVSKLNSPVGLAAIQKLEKLSAQEWQDISADWTVRWFEQRVREYVNIHGYVSAGVSALLKKAASAYADGDYLRAYAMSQADHQLALKAGSCSDRGKSHELAAYEIACREGRAKRDTDALRETGSGKLARALAEEPTDVPAEGWGATSADDEAAPLSQAPGGVDGQGPHSSPPIPTETAPTLSDTEPQPE